MPRLTASNIVMPKTSGVGFQVDEAAPTFPWHDIIGSINPKASGAGSPARAVFRGNIGQYAFALNDVCDFNFHIPHDYVPGTDMYWHLHWAHNGTNVSGTFEATNYVSYAKGYNQAAFPAEATAVITYDTVDLTTTPRYQHRIDEIQITNAGGDASHIDRGLIEVDGIMLITTKMTTIPTVTGGSLFLLFGDLHYQSTDIGTKQKNGPNFYT